MRAGFEDYDFWLSIIESGGNVYQIQEKLFRYRKHPRKNSRYDRIQFQDLCTCYNTIFRRHRKLYQAHVDVLFRIIHKLQTDIMELQEKNDRRLHKRFKRLLKKMKLKP
ncbi:MAG: hypothetical protein GF344_10380 [Chitinivibrionales bacterium]|nr:hypothetical protein [Chitinivibrionales bacterium]